MNPENKQGYRESEIDLDKLEKEVMDDYERKFETLSPMEIEYVESSLRDANINPDLLKKDLLQIIKCLLFYRKTLDQWMSRAESERAKSQRLIECLKLILNDEHCDWITNGSLKIAEELIKEYNEP